MKFRAMNSTKRVFRIWLIFIGIGKNICHCLVLKQVDSKSAKNGYKTTSLHEYSFRRNFSSIALWAGQGSCGFLPIGCNLHSTGAGLLTCSSSLLNYAFNHRFFSPGFAPGIGNFSPTITRSRLCGKQTQSQTSFQVTVRE